MKITKRVYMLIRTELRVPEKPAKIANYARPLNPQDIGALDPAYTWEFKVTPNIILAAGKLAKDLSTFQILDWSFDVDTLLGKMKGFVKAEVSAVFDGGTGSVRMKWDTGQKIEDRKAHVLFNAGGGWVNCWWEIPSVDVVDVFEEWVDVFEEWADVEMVDG
jgi:hypothetical protein